jgi:hypothetical protein
LYVAKQLHADSRDDVRPDYTWRLFSNTRHCHQMPGLLEKGTARQEPGSQIAGHCQSSDPDGAILKAAQKRIRKKQRRGRILSQELARADKQR